MGPTRQQILAKYRDRYTNLCSNHEGFPSGSFEEVLEYYRIFGLAGSARAKPVFEEFSNWVLEQAKALGVKNVWFSGRDSLPLVNLVSQSQAWKESGLHISMHPFCRGNLYFAYEKRFDAVRAKIQKDDILKHYLENQLTGESVAIVDFGFFGTLERTHRLILEEAGLDTNFIKGHLLFLKAPKSIDDKNVFDKGISKKLFDPNKLAKLVQSDNDYGEKVAGFFDVKMRNRPKFMKDGFTYEDLDLPFVFWLQESGSGVMDSVFSLSSKMGNELRFGSAYQLKYWESYAGGISDKSNRVEGGIEQLYSWFKQNEVTLREMIAIEDRDICKVIPTYGEFIRELNKELAENGFQMATLVDSEVWPIPS